MPNVTRKQIIALLEQQQYRCAATGWPLTPETASLDHVVPVANGGAHAIENMQVIDWRVNKAKGTMSMDELIHLCRAVITHQEAPTRPTDEAAVLP